MYNVTLTVKYAGVFVDGGNRIFDPSPQPYQFTNWGDHFITVPNMGDIKFIDLGNKKLAPYTNPKIPWTEKTWGGLIRYRGHDAYFRYEGQGHVGVTIGEHGSVHLHFDQGGMIIQLEDLTVE